MSSQRTALHLKPSTRNVLRAALFAAVVIGPILLILPDGSSQGSPVTGGVSLAISPLHHLAFGGSDGIDDCAYAELHDYYTSAGGPHINDLRLVPCQGKAAFSFVADSDTVERSYATGSGNTWPAVRLAFTDVDANGGYSPGDGLYITTGSGTSLVATGSASSFTIRLLGYSSYAAGSWVIAGDPDIVSYGSFAQTIAGSWGWVDDDSSTVLSSNDRVYLMPGYAAGYPKGSQIPSNAILMNSPPVAGTATTSPAGVRTAATSVSVSPIHHLAFGGSGALDDCAYADLLRNGAIANAPHPYALRLVPCSPYATYTLVGAGDSQETHYAAGPGNTAPSVRLAFSDVNANAAFDENDGLFLTTGTNNQMPGTSSPSSFTIRITGTQGTPPGAWALAGDPDIVNYGNSAQTIAGSFTWVDEDRSGSLSAGDEVYLLPGYAAGYPAGSQLPSSSILLHAVAQTHMDCYSEEHGFYNCENPPPTQSPATPTPTAATATPETSPPNATQPVDTAEPPIEPYNLPAWGSLGTIAAFSVAAGGATAFFRRRH